MSRTPVLPRPGSARAGTALVATCIAMGATLAPVRARAEGTDDGRASYVADQRNLMLGLAAWSAASAVAGTTLLLASDRDHDLPRYFGLQTLAWGLVDGAIAGIALATLPHGDDGASHPAGYWDDQRRSTRTVFWVNAALDVGYVAAGALLWALGKTDALRGTGAAIVLQGGFLLAFDTTGARVISPR